MKKTALSLITLALASGAAVAQTAPAAPAAPEPESTLSYNIGVVTDYRYRGISQSSRNPAVQVGADYAHKSGFYIGAWHSTIQWITDNNVVATATTVKGAGELDIYGGYKGEIVKGLGFDVGMLRYEYLGNTLEDTGGTKYRIYDNANTTEVYGALSYGMFTAKYSFSTTPLFGNLKSQGSGYLDLSATVDMGNGLSVVPHFGAQSVANVPVAAYNDYSITLNKDFGNGMVASVAFVTTNADKNNYARPIDSKFLGESAGVIGLKYTF
jgi:uncharacterized protein (TIGR02001 family)